MEGYYSYAVPGYPDLPSKIYRIAVPPDIDLHSIEVEYFCGGVVSFGSFQIREIPPLVTWVDGIQIVGKKADVYLKDSYYPEKVVEYLGFSQMRKWCQWSFKSEPFMVVKSEPLFL
ncbi:MAG: hypothetical protein H8D67_20835 [Deltaproteobacteria bacterium]|nr:hypothetical protein [Deltaproteobacteria bacterium]